MSIDGWNAFSEAELHTLAEAYIERDALEKVTVDQILVDQSRLTNPRYVLGMIEEILLSFDGYPVYASKADHLLRSFRSTLQETGPLPSQMAYRQDLLKSMQLATLIRPLKRTGVVRPSTVTATTLNSRLDLFFANFFRPLKSTGGVQPSTVAATNLNSRLEVLFQHVDEVLSDYECGGAIYAAPEYQWPHLTESLRSVVERADDKVIEACHALINSELTFFDECAYVRWHLFTTAICHKATFEVCGFLHAHHVWLLLKSHTCEYPVELLPVEVRRKHDLAVALYQTALDSFARDSLDS